MKKLLYIIISLVFITSTIVYSQVLNRNVNKEDQVKLAFKAQRADKYDFIDFNMIDNSCGWAISKEGILKTEDGGVTWRDVAPRNMYLSDKKYISSKKFDDKSLSYTFLDKEIAFIAYKEKNSINIFKTLDGGKRWGKSTLNLEDKWDKEISKINIDVINSNEAFVMITLSNPSNTPDVELYKTNDSGEHWTKVTKNSITSFNNNTYGMEEITGMKFVNSNRGWYTAEGENTEYPYIYGTKDGGKTWEVEDLNIPREYLNKREHIINTFSPKFSKDNKQGYLPVEFKFNNNSSMIFYKTIDGGLTWNPSIPIETQGGIDMIYGMDKDGILWVVDESGNKIYRIFYNDDNINEITSEINLKGRKVQFIDKDTGMLMLSGILYKTEDKGITWKVVK